MKHMTPDWLRNTEQEAFEVWLARTSPWGDVERVQREWEQSWEYDEWLDDVTSQIVDAHAALQREYNMRTTPLARITIYTKLCAICKTHAALVGVDHSLQPPAPPNAHHPIGKYVEGVQL